jgi:hypothetical protein
LFFSHHLNSSYFCLFTILSHLFLHSLYLIAFFICIFHLRWIYRLDILF